MSPSSEISNFDQHRNKVKLGRFSLALLPCTSVVGKKLLTSICLKKLWFFDQEVDQKLLFLKNSADKRRECVSGLFELNFIPQIQQLNRSNRVKS